MLFKIASRYLLAALLADAGYLPQPLGLLAEYLEGILAEMLHDQPGCAWADAFDDAAAQIALDAAQGGGCLNAAGACFELLAILRVVRPFAPKQAGFACGQGGQRAYNRDDVALRAHLNDRPAVIVIAKDGIGDRALQLLQAFAHSSSESQME